MRNVLGQIAAGKGDLLPVSAIPAGGTFPTGTAQYEKRNIAQFIPVWDKDLCIQCGKCVMVCPHAVIRAKVYSPELADKAPTTFQWAKPKWKGMENDRYTLAGCSRRLHRLRGLRGYLPGQEQERRQQEGHQHGCPGAAARSRARKLGLLPRAPRGDRSKLSHTQVKDLQLLQPLFEFSGACSGCGETAYIKLLTQLFGDRLYIANATGCSSIYGGNLPTTPYSSNAEGRGPTWANSLFEDNAEFGFGMRIALDQQKEFAELLVTAAGPEIGVELVAELLDAPQKTETEINQQRERVLALSEKLAGNDTSDAHNLLAIADALVRKSVWILGGDGWAFDIGFGGLDHVLGSGKNVNVLVLDTEVYSNTGGQMSKATPRGAVAKFAASGKPNSRKDLAMEAVSYGSVYVAQVALGGNDSHVIKAFQEAEAHDGPSLIIAYSSCIAHGYDLVHGLEQQKLAVQSGYWPLMRYNPSPPRDGQESLPARLQGALDPAQGVHLSRGSLHHARAQQSGAGRGTAQGSTGRCRAPVARLLRAGRHARPRRDAPHRAEEKAEEKLAAVDCRRRRMIDLSMQYLGLKLSGPIVVSSTPLSESIDNVRHMEDAGASAIVLTSLFEEQLALESRALDEDLSRGTDSFAESLGFLPDLTTTA